MPRLLGIRNETRDQFHVPRTVRGALPQIDYLWRKKYCQMGVAEIRRLRQLEEENRKLKQVVADPTLDKLILQEVLAKKA